MISNEQELKAAQERIERFQSWLLQMTKMLAPKNSRQPPVAIVSKLSECKPR